MKSVVVPVDDSRGSKWAINYVIEHYRADPVRLHLLNVQPPLSSYVSRFFSATELQDFHRENGLATLKSAIDSLRVAGIPHSYRVLVGNKAETILNFARENGCYRIILPKFSGLLPNFGLGSVGGQIRHLIGGTETFDICEVY